LDKRALAAGKAEMRRELGRAERMLAAGGQKARVGPPAKT
jgi:hypothetical protein